MSEVWDLVATERTTLADFLETLTPEEWAVDSLCDGWTVRDVAAHVAWGNTSPPLKTVGAIIRGGFRANAVNARLGREFGQRPPEQIVARLREVATSRVHTPGTTPVDCLADMLCHDLDIRVPLKRPRTSPAEPFRRALTRYAGMGFPLHLAFGANCKAMAKGLRLVAEDVGWTHGEGPTVQGSGSALMRALTGRPVGPDELTGPGAPVLYARLP
ncbi:MAG: maleylpyruvate isomerase family mycothiol-dependent enzyme [Nocardioides sp.]